MFQSNVSFRGFERNITAAAGIAALVGIQINTEKVKHISAVALTSGQSYKPFTIVNYDSRVVLWGIFKSGTTLES